MLRYCSSLILRISLRPKVSGDNTLADFPGELGVLVSDDVQRVQVDCPDLLVRQALLVPNLDQLDGPVDLHLLVKHLVHHHV